MDNPRYSEINTLAQLVEELREKNTVWLIVLGSGAWTDTALQKAKEKATDNVQRKVIWLRDLQILQDAQRTFFFGDSPAAVIVSIAMNGGVAHRLDETAAQKSLQIDEAFENAEVYEQEGCCFDGWCV